MNSLVSLACDCAVLTYGTLGLYGSYRVWLWALANGKTPQWLLDLADWLTPWKHLDSAGFVVRSDDDCEEREATETQETIATCFQPSKPDPARHSQRGAHATESSPSQSIRTERVSGRSE